jgi:hypothetical protein
MSGREGSALRPAERLGRTLDRIRNRFPRRSDMIAVLAVAVFVCFTWTLIGFFNKLSSFILYFTLGEIANILAFMMAFALLESLVAAGLLILLSAVLPASWLKEGFAVKGFVILLVATATAILFQKALRDYFPSLQTLLTYSLLPLLLVALLVWFIHSRPRLQRILLSVQDRILIMLFIYLPIGVIGLLVVMARDLL